MSAYFVKKKRPRLAFKIFPHIFWFAYFHGPYTYTHFWADATETHGAQLLENNRSPGHAGPVTLLSTIASRIPQFPQRFGLPRTKRQPSHAGVSAAAGRNTPDLDGRAMALTNFIVTVAVVGAGVLLFTTDIRRSGAVFRRNARQLRQWLEEDTASAASK